MNEVTFGEFRRLAERKHWTPEYLAKKFAGRIEQPSEFFHRVMEEKRAHRLIPYRSVAAFYAQELGGFQIKIGNNRACACGCGAPVFDRQKWASPGCQKRIARQKVRDSEKGVRQGIDFVEAKPGQTGVMATLPLTEL